MSAPHGWRAIRAVLAISLVGIWSIVAVLGGWLNRFEASVLPPSASHVRLIPTTPDPQNGITATDLAAIHRVPEVRAVHTQWSASDTVLVVDVGVVARQPATVHGVSSAWLRVAGVRLSAGRMWGSEESSSPVAVVSGPWPREPRFLVWQGRQVTVIGRVVSSSLTEESRPHVWLPLLPRRPSRAQRSYLVEVDSQDGADGRVAGALSTVFRVREGAAASREPSVLVLTGEAQRDGAARVRRTLVSGILLCSSVPFVLLGIGVAATLRLATQRRQTEFGIRRAVGARRQDIVDLIVNDAMRLAWGATWRAVVLGGVVFGVLRLVGYDVEVPWSMMMAVTALPWIVCFGAAVGPAADAASRTPVDAFASAVHLE